MNRSTPSLGERRAAAGLRAQYRVAAFLAYEALLARRLEAVRLADPEAGRVDDFQLLTPGRLDAYSIKWQRYPEPFTLNQLLSSSSSSSEENKPPLIAQLADGWKRLRVRDPDRTVIVHLVTNAYASTRGDGPLAPFLEECWKPRAQAEPSSPMPDRWQLVWERIRSASSLSVEEFPAFVRDCRLDFGFALPEATEPGPLPLVREAQTRYRDLGDLGDAFFRLVADPSYPVEIPRSRLISEVGWQERLDLRNIHEFPEPTIPYREIVPTVNALEKALERLTGGYLLLHGTPGSGKSTLLTQTLRYRPERVVRYYAFVPDSLNRSRGESANFLNDVILTLEERGIRVGQSLLRADLSLLADRLDAQLQLLHKEWRETGRKTILLVDGLDHIPREQSPSRSLLADLPSPNRVPDGVYILLGSQTDQLPGLLPDVLSQIEQPARRITMQVLEREAVQGIVSQAELDPAPTAEEREKIFQLSGGHPLALAYLLNRLRSANRKVSDVLAEIEPFPGRIDEQYNAHWRLLQGDRDLVELLALLARIRGPIELLWVERWASKNALYRLHREFGHYFRLDLPGRWYFFHNSFRVFLLDATQRLPGVSSSEGDLSLYRRLADAASQADAPWNWNEIFYRVKAGDQDRALELATLAAFRGQFFAGRPWPDIRGDLELLLPLTLPRYDTENLVRLVFIGMEIDQRAFNLEEYAECPISELFVGLGETRAALDWAREGMRVRLKNQDGLRFAAALAKLGLREEARRFFDLSEPLEILGGSQAVRHRRFDDVSKLLKLWAEISPEFRDVPTLLGVIGQIHCQEEISKDLSQEETTRDLQDQLRFALLRAIQRLHRWGDHDAVMACWDPARKDDWEPWYWGNVHAAREAFSAGQRERALSFVGTLLSRVSQEDLSPDERIALAECVCRILGEAEQAQCILDDVSLPPLADLQSSHLSSSDVEIRLRLHRLHALLGDRRPLTEVVPDAANRADQGLIYFERALVIVARLWATAWVNHPLPGSEFGREAEKVLRSIFRRPDPKWSSWYQTMEHRRDLCRSLIGAARLHGPEALEALRLAFEQEWTRPDDHPIWSPDLIRESALALSAAGAPKSWVITWCVQAGNQARDEANVPERIKHLAAQVRSWLDLGEIESARAAFMDLLHNSLGVHRKETQTNSWISWAQRANDEDTSGASKRLQLLASSLPDLADKEVLSYAARALLKAAWNWHPGAAKILFDWMLQRGLVDFTHGLQNLLEQALESGTAAARIAVLLFEEILLPLLRTAEEELIEKVVKALHKDGGRNGVQSLFRLVNRILVASLGSNRKAWVTAVRQATEEAGLSWSQITADIEDLEILEHFVQPTPEVEAQPTFSPERNWRREEAELKEQLHSLESVETFLSGQSASSFSRWENVLEELLLKLNPDQLVRLAELLRDQYHPVRALNQIIRRLLSLSQPEKGWAVGELALGATEASGWIWRATGGVRIETFSILREINKERASKLAFRTLIEDLRVGTVGFSSFGFELHEIIPLLDDTVSFQNVWDNLETYVEALFPHRNPLEQPLFGSLAGGPSEPCSVLNTLVIDLIDHPISAIAHGSQRIVVDLLRRGEPSLLSIVSSVLSDPTQSRQKLLICLEAIAEEAPQAVKALEADLQGLALSLHFGERFTSCRLLDLLRAAPPPKPAPRELPLVYILAFPEREESYALRPIVASEPLPPTEDPVAVASIVQHELRIIAAKSGFQPAALYNRATQLVLDPAIPNVYEKEVVLGKQLESVGLRFAFQRPRSAAARRAVSFILAELTDAGRLSPSDFSKIRSRLTYFDPLFLRMFPRPRPVCISPIPERLSLRSVSDDWTAGASLTTSALSTSSAEYASWIILAEESRLRWLDWTCPTEVRLGVRAPSALTLRRSAEGDFLRSYCPEWHGMAHEYEQLRTGKQSPIVRRFAFWHETPAQIFPAFNPSVAHVLKWIYTGESCFRWRNSQGQVMVESLWWQDGCPNFPPPESSAEVGEGWLVRASPAAWRELQDLYPDLIIRRQVLRTAEGQQQHSVKQ